MHKADYYKVKDNTVLCTLCPQACLIHDGKVGLCSVRYNKNGSLYSLIYSRISSKNLDPIEKKPLYHFYPKSKIFSVGSLGCNFGCVFCQNWEIAQISKDHDFGLDPYAEIKKHTFNLSPDELVSTAMLFKDEGNIGIAYTYNEPFIWFEYVRDCSVIAKQKGLKNVLVTNGYVSKKPLQEMLPVIDAMNIDLKGFSDEIYKRIGAKVSPVKNTIRIVAQSNNCHLEITNLIVPKFNDDMELFKEMVDWIANVAGRETPFHISRYFPSYKYSEPPTGLGLLEKAAEIASKKLKYVYLGNV